MHTAGFLFNRSAGLGHVDALGSSAADREPVLHWPAASHPASSLEIIARATVTRPFLFRILFAVVRRQALALVTRCLRHGDLECAAARAPAATRLCHAVLDRADSATFRPL